MSKKYLEKVRLSEVPGGHPALKDSEINQDEVKEMYLDGEQIVLTDHNDKEIIIHLSNTKAVFVKNENVKEEKKEAPAKKSKSK